MLRSLARQWGLPSIDVRLPRFLAERRRQRPTLEVPDAPVRFTGPELGPPFDPHSFYPAAWLARLIAKSRPSLHGDIGSRVTDIGVLSAFVPVIFVDVWPPHVQLPGLAPVAGDITRLPLPDKSLISLSSLNVIGHTGFGRAGAPSDPAAAASALGELQRVLGYRGSLYLSVPVGRERVVNGQRIFAPETILRAVPSLRLRRFSYVGDDHMLHADASLDEAVQQDHACGLFEFERA